MDLKYRLAIMLNSNISLELKNMINDNMPIDHILYAMIHYHQQNKIDNDDLIVCRMVNCLNQNDFVLSKEYLIRLHKLIFIDHNEYLPGKLRNFDVSLKSKYLNGKRVIFSKYTNINDYLTYDFNEEIKRISKDRINNIKELSGFMVNLYNIHPFVKGNIVSIITFLLKYLDENYIRYDINYLIDHYDQLYKGLILASDNETKFSDDQLIITFMKNFIEE